jgi:hypothetical protein
LGTRCETFASHEVGNGPLSTEQAVKDDETPWMGQRGEDARKTLSAALFIEGHRL